MGAFSFLFEGLDLLQLAVGCLTELQISQRGGAAGQREIVCPTFEQWEQSDGNQGLDTLMRTTSPDSN